MIRRPRKAGGIPVLKLPPAKLNDVVLALRAHEYNRDGFKFAVMDLFASDKVEKSVFRGMAIPTLRALGLLTGFEAELHLSCDGALLAAGADAKTTLVAAHLLVELESTLQIQGIWNGRRTTKSTTTVVAALCDLEAKSGSVTSDTRARVRRWLGYLEHFGVIVKSADNYERPVLLESNISKKRFMDTMMESYRTLSPKTIGEPTVPIDEVARAVALALFEDGVIVTRKRFDQMLSECLTSGRVPIHLHHSMGAEQRLFAWQGESYQAMSIRRAANA